MKSIDMAAAADALFSATQQQPMRENIAKAAISNGTTLYTNGKYEEAIKEFKRAVSLAPQSSNAPDAYNYVAISYLKLDKPADAINAYKASIRLDPNREDTHVKLGNLYLAQNQHLNAESEFKAAIKIKPSSTANIYNLGQLYLESGRYREAETQFTKIINLAPGKLEGYYGLGLVSNKEGRYDDAIKHLKEAISKNGDFNYAYIDLGYAYADSGQLEEAKKQVDILKTKDTGMASILSTYIDKNSKPRFSYVDYIDTFNSLLPPKTPLSSINPSLAIAGASVDVSVKFFFDKPMDMISVLTPYNWQIGRATFGTPGGGYNWGLGIPQTEAAVSSIPKNVIYDPVKNSATVTFTLTQNATADATIDPSHLVFKFNGKDINGLTMDPKANEFDGSGWIF